MGALQLDEDPTCPVCMKEYVSAPEENNEDQTNEMVMFNCGHVVCKECALAQK